MLRKTVIVAFLLALTAGLSACVPPPPREHVVYRETDRAYSRDDDTSYSGRYCHVCGTVREVDRVEIRQGNSGGGAVLGAIIGGLIGNQIGRGSGRAAATAAGVVGGAAIGNSVEEDNARRASGRAWRFRVELDDGRWATVTQYANPGFHPGDRVLIRGDHLEFTRR